MSNSSQKKKRANKGGGQQGLPPEKEVPGTQEIADFLVGSPEGEAGVFIRETVAARMPENSPNPHELTKQNLDPVAVAQALHTINERVLAGDLTDIQRILATQVQMFHQYSLKHLWDSFGASNLEARERLADLALKFQNHSRRTAATLAGMINPKHTTIIKDSNVAQNQQINQGLVEPEKKNYSESKLLEQIDGQRLDTGAQGETISGDSPLEAMAELDRAADT